MNKIKCVLCGVKISDNNTYITNHLRRKHNLELVEYLEKNFTDIGELTNSEKCSFCENDSRYKIKIDHNEREYYYDYSKGFFCNEGKCKNNISIEFLGEKYNSFKFSKIGSKTEYLSKLHQITIDEAKGMKYNPPDPEKKFICNLNGFIKKFGEKEGTEKYYKRLNKVINNLDPYAGLNNLELFINKYGKKEGTKRYNIRIDKISKSNTKKWYIEKFGVDEGTNRWELYINKLRNHINLKDTSNKITEFLDNNNINYSKEVRLDFNDGRYCFIDYYLNDFKIYLEYFGDYWHCNPSIYESNYYHQYIDKSAKDIWKKDEVRLNKILKHTDKSILVIWESTEIDEIYLLKMISNISKKKAIVKI